MITSYFYSEFRKPVEVTWLILSATELIISTNLFRPLYEAAV